MGDSVYNNHLASEATGKIQELEKAVSKLVIDSNALSNFADRVKKMSVTNHSVITGNAHPGGGGTWFYCGTSRETMIKQLCTNAVHASVTHIGSSSGCGCGCVRYSVVCINY